MGVLALHNITPRGRLHMVAFDLGSGAWGHQTRFPSESMRWKGRTPASHWLCRKLSVDWAKVPMLMRSLGMQSSAPAAQIIIPRPQISQWGPDIPSAGPHYYHEPNSTEDCRARVPFWALFPRHDQLSPRGLLRSVREIQLIVTTARARVAPLQIVSYCVILRSRSLLMTVSAPSLRLKWLQRENFDIPPLCNIR